MKTLVQSSVTPAQKRQLKKLQFNCESRNYNTEPKASSSTQKPVISASPPTIQACILVSNSNCCIRTFTLLQAIAVYSPFGPVGLREQFSVITVAQLLRTWNRTRTMHDKGRAIALCITEIRMHSNFELLSCVLNAATQGT
jgi:hypothetical protein